jgi:hypothetical protein
MNKASQDERSNGRKARDEAIAAEPPLAAPSLPPGSIAAPIEAHLARQPRRPMAVEGVVENGLVRPLDPAVKLPEFSRVIIIASGDVEAVANGGR